MDKPKNIYQKLLVIQQTVGGLGKDKTGPNGHYKYVTGDKVLGEIKPLMNELGLILMQETLSIENTRQDYVLGNGKVKQEIHSKVMMRFTWVDCETSERVECLWGANGQNDWDKGVGSAYTYGERYFLLKFFHIATDEDDIDNPTAKDENKNTGPAKNISKPEFTIDHKSFTASHKAISEGTKTIEDLKSKFTVSDAVVKILTSPYNEK